MSFPILDVAIGISFVYLLLALICTTVNEMIAGKLRTRARFLDQGISRLFGNDQTLKEKLYAHPLIRSLSSDNDVNPSYIPAGKFATALMDILFGGGKPRTDYPAVREAIAAARRTAAERPSKKTDEEKPPAAAADPTPAADAPDDHLAKSLTAVFKHEVPEESDIRGAIEQWFDDGMDRVSGWYKRHTQKIVLILAAVVTLALNADTLNIANTLWVNPAIRAALVEEAKIRSQKARPEELLPMVEYPNPQDPTASEPVNAPEQALSPKEQELLGQLTGWSEEWQKWRVCRAGHGLFQGTGLWLVNVIWTHFLGWLLTIIAVSMGAPFWFDTLNRFMNIRNAGRAPDERKDKSRPAK